VGSLDENMFYSRNSLPSQFTMLCEEASTFYNLSK
jgi:hypothetical protein